MGHTVLAGDIGGTKTNLALYEIAAGGGPEIVREESFPSREYHGLEGVLAAFLVGDEGKAAAAVFGVAGPVVDDVVLTTNLPWRIEPRSLAKVIGCERVRLMNDLETTAYGALFLPEDRLHVLQRGKERRGNAAVIAAGTGLGQALLFWDGQRHRPSATEGGHADYAPRTDAEIGLLRFLKKEYGRVSWERVVSGPGLHAIFRYLTEELKKPVAPSVQARLRGEDPSAVVGDAAVEGACATCVEAVDLFLGAYGAQAGNLALTGLTIGGVYVGGGIVTKLLPKVTGGGFLEAFQDKGRYATMMSEMPVRILLDPKASLLGAAYAARDLLST